MELATGCGAYDIYAGMWMYPIFSMCFQFKFKKQLLDFIQSFRESPKYVYASIAPELSEHNGIYVNNHDDYSIAETRPFRGKMI